MNRLALPMFALFVATTSSLVACGADPEEEVDASENNLVEKLGGCSVETPSSVSTAFKASKDPFKAKILATTGCPTVGGAPFRGSAGKSNAQIPEITKALVARGCRVLGRSFVSEKGMYQKVGVDFTPSGLDPRFVETIECGSSADGVEGRIYLAGPEPAFHIISFDAASRSWNFYSTNAGTSGADFVFHGNSFQQAKTSEVAPRTGGFPDHPCTTCHTSGGLLLRELRFPWANWHADPRSGAAQLVDITKTMALTGGASPKLRVVEELEIDTARSLVAVNQTRVASIKALIAGTGVSPATALNDQANATTPYTLKSLLTPLFCETEINIATSKNSLSDQALTLPPDLFLNRLLDPGVSGTSGINVSKSPGQLSRLDMTGLNDKEDFTSATQITIPTSAWSATTRALGVSVPADKRKTSGDGRFPMPIAGRAFSNDDYVSRLVGDGVLEEKFVADVLMVDFPNPVFSKIRCDLLKAVPGTPIVGLTPAKITKAVTDAFNTSARSFPGTAEYNANRTKTIASHAATVDAFLGKCAATLPADATKLYTLTAARRAGLFADARDPSKDAPTFGVEKFVRDQFLPVSASVGADTALATALDQQCNVVRR